MLQRGKSSRVHPAISGLLCLVSVALAAPLAGCGVQIDHHGHVFNDVDQSLIKPGMSKEAVVDTLGSPDTTGTIAGETFFYISSTDKRYSFLKPWETQREVLAISFNSKNKVTDVNRYGLKNGLIVNYSKNKTPARGKEMSILAQIFGNMAQRSMFATHRSPSTATPTPGL